MSLLLLTGAAGLVGSGFLSRTTLPVLCPTRQPHIAARSHPWLFWDGSPIALEPYRDSITAILHCAADTRFGAPLPTLRSANVECTANLLAFARRCPRLERFGFVSTTFVFGAQQGSLAPLRATASAGFINPYQQSKFEAEDLVWNAMPHLPAAIYRISSILAADLSGRVSQFNHCHQLLRLLGRNPLDFVPGLPGVPVDLVTADWVSSALLRYFEEEFTPSRAHHLCAGAAHSLTVEHLLALASKAYHDHPRGQACLPLHLPRLVPLADYHAWAETRQDSVSRELTRVLSLFLPHFALYQDFTGNSRGAVSLPDAATLFSNTAAWCLTTNWGREAA